MTHKELATFDGKNGRATYVAVGGIIYDVSSSSRWKEGTHEKMHLAGTDLTEALATAPHIKTVLERFPVVDQLQNEAKKPLEIAGIPLLSVIIMAFVFLLMITTYML
jgi:predicted heme/steroid binding protein